MADKKRTAKIKFAIDIGFDTSLPIRSGPLRSIQKGAASGKKAVAITDEVWTNTPIEIHWDEVTDPIAKTVTMSITQIKVKIRFSCAITYANTIPKNSPCFRHVTVHERKHVASRRSSLNRYRKLAIQYIQDATSPQSPDELEVKQSSAKKVRDETFKRIHLAMHEACEKILALSKKDSDKIDTPSEDRATSALCSEFV